MTDKERLYYTIQMCIGKPGDDKHDESLMLANYLIEHGVIMQPDKVEEEIEKFKKEVEVHVTNSLAEGIKRTFEKNKIEDIVKIMNRKSHRNRIDFICANAENIGWLPDQMDSDEAIGVLVYFLLGKNWYIPAPIGKTQANSDIVHEILERYSKEYREALKRGRE